MARTSFDESARKRYLGLLAKLAASPPSADSMDPVLVQKIREFLAQGGEKTAVQVWNFYKELLDLIVHDALADSFCLRLVDLEAPMIAPEGAFSQEAGNMDQAPWRKPRT